MPVLGGSDIRRFYCTLAEVACYCSLLLDRSTTMIHVMLDTIVGTSWSVKPSRRVSFQFFRRSANIYFERNVLLLSRKRILQYCPSQFWLQITIITIRRNAFSNNYTVCFNVFFFSKLKTKMTSAGIYHHTKNKHNNQYLLFFCARFRILRKYSN
jgi:hypothetical protein